jgi:hypothetical protein
MGCKGISGWPKKERGIKIVLTFKSCLENLANIS